MSFIISGILIASITGLTAVNINEKIVPELRNVAEVKSISDNLINSSHMQGSFFLSCGSITADGNTSLVYYAMTGNSENGYTINKFNTETTHLFLDGDKNLIMLKSGR